MRLLRTLLFTLLALSCALGSQVSQNSEGAVLPAVTANSLDRVRVALPADFTAPLNLLILSFVRDQQAAVEGWIPVLPSGGKTQTWVLPISARESGLYRWWLNASLRGDLPPTLPRRYWVPLYVNKTQFLGSLQVSSEKEVVLLLTDKTGHVLWRTTGPVADSKKDELNKFVNQFMSQPGPH
ncbi:MAG: hypothetical protein WA510_24950 [Acidobacteriaceae bacterium]